MTQRSQQTDLKQLQANGQLLQGNLFKPHFDQVRQRLRDLGADAYDLAVPESNIIPLMVHAAKRF